MVEVLGPIADLNELQWAAVNVAVGAIEGVPDPELSAIHVVEVRLGAKYVLRHVDKAGCKTFGELRESRFALFQALPVQPRGPIPM